METLESPVELPAESEKPAMELSSALDEPATRELFKAVDISAELAEEIVAEALAERIEEAIAPNPPPSDPRSQSRPARK
ncbi:hypothetical protein Nepgr_029985 [Nepenthes gracilis]|uniref:Uncharacterized protein n=1 Tax=Nepenthes gracilis TaxID=150966 RepID=A0AAD3TGD7_NEPGR|nr:hypothetical protein Nepgr_029985 [Nepenthes gracilis]